MDPFEVIKNACEQIISAIGENPSREGLLLTPERYANALLDFTRGYKLELKECINDAVFTENYSEIVTIKDIEFNSLCEHHLIPFHGKVHVGYIPKGQILGLSKFARIVDMCSKRLQVQERLTHQIASAIDCALCPSGVAVLVESMYGFNFIFSHGCMQLRGVKQPNCTTLTVSMLGAFSRDTALKSEFMSLIGK